MRFINVTADRCNEIGAMPFGDKEARVEFLLNSELIGGIIGDKVLINDTKVLNLSNNYFINIRLVKPEEIVVEF